MRYAIFFLLITLIHPLLAGPSPLAPPSNEVLDEARALVESFKQTERGPYSRIRWFCNDGTTHPPQPYACVERGGACQHAEYSAERNRLAVDAAQVSGIAHRVFGKPTDGLFGIYPGVARGRLHLVEAAELEQGLRVADDEIVVPTETVADLEPVAGILTLGEGYPLSHVQMLARNLGIPNASVSPQLLPILRSQVRAGTGPSGDLFQERFALSLRAGSRLQVRQVYG